MGKKTVDILRAFYREQEKEVPKTDIHPDDNTQALIEALSITNPIVRIAKRNNLSFTTIDGDRIVVVNPDKSRIVIKKVKSGDIPVTERTISFGQQ